MAKNKPETGSKLIEAAEAAAGALANCAETAPSLRPLVKFLNSEIRKAKTPRHYVVHVYGCTDPQPLVGPYKNSRSRDLQARRMRNSHDEEDAFFWLDIDESGTPSIGAYSGGFMDGVKGFDQ